MANLCVLVHLLAALTYFASVVLAKPNFSGNFILSNIVFESSFQVHPSSTVNSSIAFTFCDEDRIEIKPDHCFVEWAVGTPPPTTPEQYYCNDLSVNVWFPEGTYSGTQNVTIALSHTYVDNNIGTYPYNSVTKFGEVTLTHPGTPNYECDIEKGRCASCDGATIIAPVTRAIS